MKAFLWLVLITLLVGAVPACSAPLQVSNITPEDLMSATLSWADVRTTLPDSANWWPQFPEFYGKAFNDNDDQIFYISQSYKRSDLSDTRKVETALTLYKNEATASAGFKAMLESSDKGCTIVSGPEIGDECRYMTRTSDGRKNESIVRFRVGAVIGRVAAVNYADYEKPEVLCNYTRPIVRKLRWLMAGKSLAKPIPVEITSLIPPASATDSIGPVFGTITVPVETWALDDTMNNPVYVRDLLRGLGISNYAIRRYGSNKAPGNIIEAYIFTFPTEDAAAKWYKATVAEPSITRKQLYAGNTGSMSDFVHKTDIQTYELTLAKGRYVLDFYSYAPFADTNPAAEDDVPGMAEIWYRCLPAH